MALHTNTMMKVAEQVTKLIYCQLRRLHRPPQSAMRTCCYKRTLSDHQFKHSWRKTRYFHSYNGPLRHGDYEYQDPKSPDEIVNITYIDRNGDSFPVQGKVGDNVMYLAHRHEVEIEGACEASLACCTCHVVLQEEYYSKLPEIEEEEEDMLDLAPFLTATSKLSCQIILSKELEGMEVKLPQATRNFYVDGHVPQAH